MGSSSLFTSGIICVILLRISFYIMFGWRKGKEGIGLLRKERGGKVHE